MIIVAGKTIQEVKEQLATIEGLAAAGYQCGVGGETLTEVQEGLRRVLEEIPSPTQNPSAELEEDEDCCDCEDCDECEHTDCPYNDAYECEAEEDCDDLPELGNREDILKQMLIQMLRN